MNSYIKIIVWWDECGSVSVEWKFIRGEIVSRKIIFSEAPTPKRFRKETRLVEQYEKNMKYKWRR